VDLNTDSLKDLSIDRESLLKKIDLQRALAQKEKNRMKALFNRLPSIEVAQPISVHLNPFTHNLHKSELFGQVLPNHLQNQFKGMVQI
jgi:hypothetical protein